MQWIRRWWGWAKSGWFYPLAPRWRAAFMKCPDCGKRNILSAHKGCIPF